MSTKDLACFRRPQPHSQDLYDLFCDGLKASSTTIFTSTPLEEDEEPLSDAAPQATEDRPGNTSTEAQAGSSESPPKSPAQRIAESSNLTRTARNASPVDFVDHGIAIIRRDLAGNVQSQGSAKSKLIPATNQVLSNPQENSSGLKARPAFRKKLSPSKSSSETDFESAETPNHRDAHSTSRERPGPKCKKFRNLVDAQEASNERSCPENRISKEDGKSTNLNARISNETDRPCSDSSEDLLNPKRLGAISKPRSSASSDGIVLRLSTGDSEDDVNITHSSNNESDVEKSIIEGSVGGAARCRPFLRQPTQTNNVVCENTDPENAVKPKSTVLPKQSCKKNCKGHDKNKDCGTNALQGFCEPPDHQALYATSHIHNVPAKQVETNAPTTHPEVNATRHLNSTDSNVVKQLLILNGVVAYVEVRSGHDNRSRGVRAQLVALGAHVMDKLSKEVTHVIFNEGLPSVLKRAQEYDCHLVSVLWIEECKNLGRRVDESEYPPLNLHMYDPTSATNKYRKLRSLQPDFDEDKCEERINKHLKRIRRKAQMGAQSQELDENPESRPIPKNDVLNGVKVPWGVKLQGLSVVLNKVPSEIPACGLSSSVCSDKRQKRKLMPLHNQYQEYSSPEDFNPCERLTPQCPYVTPASECEPAPLRRSVRERERPNTQPQRDRNFKRIESNRRKRPSYECRRSSVFIPRKPKRIRQVRGTPRKRNKNKLFNVMRTMVCTFMHRREIDVVAAVIKQLGGWIMEPTVSSRTSHVICGDAKRTVNLLRGIAHGCWIVHKEWVMRSVEAGRWLDEEPFELGAFPAARQCRIEREALGGHPDIFSASGAIFIAENTSPPRAELIELLQLCGAHVVNSARLARIIVGQQRLRTSNCNVMCVKEVWVLDSIQENVVQPLRNYLIDDS